MSMLTRRSFLTGTATVAGSLALGTALGGTAFGQDSRIRHFWWGNPERDKRTFAVIDSQWQEPRDRRQRARPLASTTTSPS